MCLKGRRPRFDPWVGKIPWRREWLPTPVFLPGSFHGQRNLVGYSPFFFNYKDVGDRKMSSLPPKNVHFLIHGCCKCVTIHKRVGCCCGNNQRCSILAAGSCQSISLGRQDCEIFISIPKPHFNFLLWLLSGANMFILEENPSIVGNVNEV